MPLGGWKCTIGPESENERLKLLNITCVYRDATVSAAAANQALGEIAFLLTTRTVKSGFTVVLDWKGSE